MLNIVIKASLVYILSALVWRLIQPFVLPHPLDNVLGPKRISLLFGNIQKFFEADSWDWHNDNLASYGRAMKMHGFWGSKQLWISDPLSLHHILVKDGTHYEEPAWLIESSRVTVGEGLLAAVGHRHRRQRKLLNPIFSQKHMRVMIPSFYDIAHKVRDAITKEIKASGDSREVDILSWTSRAALEIVGVAGLGHSFEYFDQDLPPSTYAKAVKAFQPLMGVLAVYRRMLHLAPALGPAWFRRMLVNLVPWKSLHQIRDVIDIMYKAAEEAIEEKKKALATGDEATMKQIEEGNDIMSILLRANMEASEEDALTDEEIMGQMSTLIFAAFDTTSSALARIMHKLANNLDVQEKLRAEIQEARKDGDVSFDTLVNLPYLEAVCRETLRVYSPVPQIARVALDDMILPLSSPIIGVNGHMIESITVPKSTQLLLGLLATNKDKAIWGEDAHEWKPDRWMKPLPETVTEARVPGVYANMMTFSGGGRACIGFKFSQLEMKIVLSILVEKFKFEPAPGKEIYFNFSGIQFPTVVGGPPQSQLPLKLSLI